MTTRLHVEALEARDCPSTANLFNGVLSVVGTDGNDTIVVGQSGTSIVAAGQSFAASSVSRVVVSAGGGDDLVKNNTTKPAVIYGGFGNDTLFGGPGNDVIYGGMGNDTIRGRAGNDVLWGGPGTNTIGDNSGANSIHPGNPNRTRTNSAVEQQIITLVNQQRAANGLPALSVNQQLNAAAQLHTRDMVAISNIFGPSVGMQHELFGTTRPEVLDRLDAVGYDNWTTSFAYGENIAEGYTSAADVMNGWMNSPGHRANILSSSFTEIGVSVVAAADGTLFFTQEFGHKT
jgi:uncharacterized protein YkwD